MKTIIERLQEHGGLSALHVTPFVTPTRSARRDYGKLKVVGWQLVAMCGDGTRIGLSSEDEDILATEQIHPVNDP